MVATKLLLLFVLVSATYQWPTYNYEVSFTDFPFLNCAQYPSALDKDSIELKVLADVLINSKVREAFGCSDEIMLTSIPNASAFDKDNYY